MRAYEAADDGEWLDFSDVTDADIAAYKEVVEFVANFPREPGDDGFLPRSPEFARAFAEFMGARMISGDASGTRVRKAGIIYAVDVDGTLCALTYDGVDPEPIRIEDEGDGSLDSDDIVPYETEALRGGPVKRLSAWVVGVSLSGLSRLRHRLTGEPTPKEPETAELTLGETPASEPTYLNYQPPPPLT